MVQEVAIRLISRGQNIFETPLPYVMRTIRNLHIDRHRRTTKERSLLDNAYCDSSRNDDQDSVEDVMISEQEVEWVLSVCNSQEREWLYLQAVEGFSADEIAHISERPRGTILSAIHRAKRKIRAYLDQQQGETIS